MSGDKLSFRIVVAFLVLFMSSLMHVEVDAAIENICVSLPRCRFNGNMSIVDCHDSGLKSVPDIPATAVTLDLSQNNLEGIPTQQLSKLSKLQSLILNFNRITEVDTFAFEGLENLTDINLSANAISKVSTRAFWKLPQLKNLDLAKNRIQAIETSTFEGLEGLTALNLSYNDIKIIPTQVLSQLPQLHDLDMSVNNIEIIPAQLVSELPQLHSLDLGFNQIETIGPLTFPGLETQTKIHFDSDKIATRNSISVPSQLRYLDMHANRIRSIVPFAFGGLQNLTAINLHQNAIQTIGSNGFAYITNLGSLDLSYNALHKISVHSFDETNSISMINLGHNVLLEVPSIGSQPFLRHLDLSHNMIVNATFPSSYSNSDTNLTVTLSSNRITTLDRFTFSHLAGSSILYMDLSSNNIMSVGPGTFGHLASIKTLNLGSNPLSTKSFRNIANCLYRTQVAIIDLKAVFDTQDSLISGLSEMMNIDIRLGMCENARSLVTFTDIGNLTIIQLTKDDLFQFNEINFPGKKNVLAMNLASNSFSTFPKYLPASLEYLDLTENGIRNLHEDAISYLGHLKQLNLQRNSIYNLWPGAFNGLRYLEVLDISHNHINSFCWEILEPLQNLTHLHLGGNSLRALTSAESYDPLPSLRFLNLSDNHCETVDDNFFESFPSLEILDLSGNDLGKFVISSDNDERLFRGLKKLEGLFLSSNSIQMLPDLILRDLVALKRLDISRNQISGWGPNMFESARSIEKIDLSYNLISVLTENDLKYFKNLQVLKLKGNPFVCTCDLLWFREWIDRTPVALPDKDSYMCHQPDSWRGVPLLKFTKSKINCDMNPETVVDVILALSAAFVVSLVTGVIVYRNRWRIRLRMYLLSKRGRLFLSTTREHERRPNDEATNDDDHHNHFDAYISCSESDNEWVVQQLLPDIDSGRYNEDNIFGGDFRLYFDPRDKEIGTMAIANIFEHMTRSRKVIVVLTQHYINDGMNIFELDQATTLYHDQELEDIIVVKVGDVPAKKVPAHLYTQMRSDRFLEWVDDHDAIERFKERLKDRLRGDRLDLC